MFNQMNARVSLLPDPALSQGCAFDADRFANLRPRASLDLEQYEYNSGLHSAG